MSDCVVIGNRAVGGDGTGDPGGFGASGLGGGISTVGPLTLTDCVIRLNLAIGGEGAPPSAADIGGGGFGLGGGIAHLTSSPVRLVRTLLEANEARGGSGGSGSAFFGRGGGRGVGGGSGGNALEVTDSMIRDNLAKGGAGGIAGSGAGDRGGWGEGGGVAFLGGPQSISGSTLSGNRAEGGDGGVGDAGTGQAGAGNGGAISKFTSILSVANSTISGNVAVAGSGGPIDPVNTRGGGIFLSTGGLLLDSVTLTASTPDGIWSDGSGSVTNSIVALQTAGPDCGAGIGNNPIASADFNIDSDGSCGFDQPHDQSGIDAAHLGLGPLADNGGPTQTHAIAPGRAAFDRGSTTLSVDQRGVARPQWFQDDVGAFEQERQVSLADVPALSAEALVALGALLALAALVVLRAR